MNESPARIQFVAVGRGSDTFSYSYDLASNLTSRVYPDTTTTTYTFDDDGRLASALAGGATTTYGYDVAGSITTIATPDGYIARYAYDRAGRLLEVAHRSDAELLSRFSYTLDPAGNRTAMTTRTGTVTYRYDDPTA
jgi:YD repeat-containing protein